MTTGPSRNCAATGYFVEFKRGWHTKADGHKAIHEPQAGIYDGSITQEKAVELERIVRDYLESKDDSPRLTAFGARGFVERLLSFWKRQSGEHAAQQVVELQAMLPSPATSSESAKPHSDMLAQDALALSHIRNAYYEWRGGSINMAAFHGVVAAMVNAGKVPAA